MKPAIASPRARALGAGLLLLTSWLAGCVSTQLELAENDPASPHAATAPLPRVGSALESTFDPAAGNPAPAASGGAHDAHDAHAAAWTCPMHPEVRKSEPGNCPICGMKLVPAKPEGNKP